MSWKGLYNAAIGKITTQGLGAGGDPAKGQLAAKEILFEMTKILHESDLVFVAAGLVRDDTGCTLAFTFVAVSNTKICYSNTQAFSNTILF